MLNSALVPRPSEQWEFRNVEPLELGTVWDTVLAGVNAVRNRGHAEWRAEDMYTAIKSNQASLHLCMWEGEYVGFVVLTRIVDPFSGQRIMFIWAAHAARPGFIERGMDEVVALSRREGMQKIVFHTPRRAWIRRLSRYGFKIGQYIMEARVD